MHQFIFRLFSIITVSLFSLFCATSQKVSSNIANINSLKYVGNYVIPFNYQFKGTTVGGLSGIDYDAKKDQYYLISDDRSEKQPARFYTAKIFLTLKGINSLIFTEVNHFLQPDGKVYPGINLDRFKTPDPEAIRYNPFTRQLVWSSEGERIVRGGDTVLVDPSVVLIQPDGTFISPFEIPANLKMQAVEKGPRKNGVLEGMSFADHYKTLYVSMEEPLFEDGPQADVTDNKAFTRIIKFDVASGKSTAQYAYKLEPVAHPSKPENSFKINGVSEILDLGNNKLLVMERSFSTGRIPCTIRLFVADLQAATDIGLMALKDNQNFIPAKKTLLLNMDDLGIYTDNIEGVCFGPLLPNGHKTLLFVADNNFKFFEKAQVLLFEVLE